MGLQKFRAFESFPWPNGAVGWRPGGWADCIGPYAKVQNCPVDGTALRVTAYATGYADTYFSVPAACKIRGRYVGGYFAHPGYGMDWQEGPVFMVLDKFKDRLPKEVQHV
jgi:hypothetical protein